jgi:hypothetical protein
MKFITRGASRMDKTSFTIWSLSLTLGGLVAFILTLWSYAWNIGSFLVGWSLLGQIVCYVSLIAFTTGLALIPRNKVILPDEDWRYVPHLLFDSILLVLFINYTVQPGFLTVHMILLFTAATTFIDKLSHTLFRLG